MIRHGFKEWAVICEALGRGEQSLILRKGGIAEEGGRFTPDHVDFWLYPTYVHQQQQCIKPQALSLWEAVEQAKPSDEEVRLTHFARISGVYEVRSLARAILLDEFHCWSEETVIQRFNYRQPGLFVLPVRIYRAGEPIVLAVKPEFEGCRTWVDFGQDLSTDGAVPVIDDSAFRRLLDRLDERLSPTTWV